VARRAGLCSLTVVQLEHDDVFDVTQVSGLQRRPMDSCSVSGLRAVTRARAGPGGLNVSTSWIRVKAKRVGGA